MRGKVVVVGAGIVGVCSALYLLREGFEVELVDPVDPGAPEQCSYGNSGGIAPGACVPNAMPGLIKSIPGWLLDPDGPISLRLLYLPHALPWLLRFVMTSRESRTREISAAMRSLNRLTLDCFQPLVRDAGCEDLLLQRGFLIVYEDERGPEQGAFGLELRRSQGVKVEFLNANEVRELEPSLTPNVKRGVFLPEQGQCPNPGRLVSMLASDAIRRGATLTKDRVEGFSFTEGRVTSVLTASGNSIAADYLVLAAGARSGGLARQLGARVPLESERGYHITVQGAAVGLSVNTMSAERKCVAAPMEGGLRLSNTVEFAGLDAPPNPHRIDILLRQAKALFPGIDVSRYTSWMGHRPGTPDSIPVIERLRAHPNVIFAFGHGHQGLIGASVTGRLVAELAAGKPTSIDLTPFRSNRF